MRLIDAIDGAVQRKRYTLEELGTLYADRWEEDSPKPVTD